MFVSQLLRVLFATALAVSVSAAQDISPSRTTRNAHADINPVGVVTRSLSMKPACRRSPMPSAFLADSLPTALDVPTALAVPRLSNRVTTGKNAVYAGSSISGYSRGTVNAFGEYRSTIDESQALLVNICQGSNVHSIYAQRSSYNYAYVDGTVQTTTNSPAVSGANSFSAATGNERKIQSAVWSLGADNSLMPSWVNANGARVSALIVHVVSGTEDSFVVTDGYSSYVNMLGPSPLWVRPL
ncbi:hypothetical protein C8T65DRAFT_699079 [Cerioporus squamosus]|nr:hypothetical protein C8T65DRAFT_699079 [Cerioporus squamosus]